MDKDAQNEFNRVWKKLDDSDRDRLHMVRMSVELTNLAKKVDRFSASVTLLAITVVADLIATHIK